MELRIPPIPSNPLSTFLQSAFQEIRSALKSHAIERRGVATVTGTLDIATGLRRVDHVEASFNGNPVTGACWLAGRPAPTDGAVRINVFTNTGAASTTAISVNWIAFGI